MPRRIGSRCGAKITAERQPAAWSSCSISATWRWRPMEYARTFSCTSPNKSSVFAARPAPLAPDLESTTIAPSPTRPARTRGTNPSSAPGGIAPWHRDDTGPAHALASELRNPVNRRGEQLRRRMLSVPVLELAASRRRKSALRSRDDHVALQGLHDRRGGGPVRQPREHDVDVLGQRRSVELLEA